MGRAVFGVLIVSVLVARGLAAQTASQVTPGDVVIENPTLINLGFE